MQTVHYWNTQYGLEINEGGFTLAGWMSDDGHGEEKTGQKKEVSPSPNGSSRRRGKK